MRFDERKSQTEIALSFFTGYYEEGVYHDDLRSIGKELIWMTQPESYK